MRDCTGKVRRKSSIKVSSEQHHEGIHISMPLLSGDMSLSFSLDLEFLTMHYIFIFSPEETLC